MAVEVKVPTLGESVTEATIGEWLKQPGDPVKLDEPVASLETDKVAVEVPSPVAGVMGTHAAPAGEDEEDHTTTLSPAVRRAVLEHGVDPSQIKGSGKDGRLTKEDVLAAAKAKKDTPPPSVSQ